MSNIENEVVSLTFDSAGFERGINNVLASLAELKSSLDFSNAQSGFSSLQSSADSIDLSHIESSLDTISGKFGVMGAAAFTAIQSVTQGVIGLGQQMANALAAPIIEGGKRRSIAIEQAKFQFAGLGQDVEASMESALAAVKGTAFSLDEAATVAAQFGASGITAGDQMTGALRGVAGVAALTSTSFAEMGHIFTDIAGQGRLTGAHLFSFATRGINMAAAMAKAWGTTEEAIRTMATNGEISFEEFTGTVDRLFGEHATKANETYTGSLANLNAAFARLGASIAAPRLEATRKFFNALAPAIDGVAEALAPLITTWTHFVNRASARGVRFLEDLDFSRLERILTRVGPHIDRIFRNITAAIRSFITPIRDAFSAVFDIPLARDFGKIAKSIQEFTHGLILSEQTATRVKNAFSGLLAVFSIVFEVLKGVGSVIVDVASALFSSGEGVGEFASNLGKTLVQAKRFLVDGGRIKDFFDNLGDTLSNIIEDIDLPKFFSSVADAIRDVLDIFGSFFSGAEDGGTVVDRLGQRLNTLTTIIGGVVGAYVWLIGKLVEFASGVKDVLQPAIDYIHDAFDGLGESIVNSLKEGDFSSVLDVLNIGVLGGLALAVKKLVDKGLGFNLLIGSDITDKIGEALDTLTGYLSALQAEVKSRAILNIAKAVGLLAISAIALSLVDSGDLAKALTALSIGFGQLVGAMVALDKLVLTPKGAANLVLIATAMVLVGAAMSVLSIAVHSLGALDWDELVKGLGGVAVLLVEVTLASQYLGANAPGMIRAGIGLIALGIALNIIAFAVKQLAGLSWGEMAKGLTAVALSLGIISGVTQGMSGGMLRIGGGLLLVSVGLIAIAGALHIMSTLDWGEMLKGLTGVAASLLLLDAASNAMKDSVHGAVAIGIMAASLIVLAYALGRFAAFDWGEILRGLVAMAGSLLLVGAAGAFMGNFASQIAAAGIALAIFSSGLVILAKALQMMGELSIAQIVTGIVALAAALILIGVGSILLVEAIPFIAAMGVAVAILGVGFLALGAGVYLLASAFKILADVGDAAFETVKNMLKGIVVMMPDLWESLAEGIFDFIDIILDAAPEIIEGVVTIIEDLIQAVIELTPQWGEAITTLIGSGLSVIREKAPDFIQTGFFLLMQLLRGIQENQEQITLAVIAIIVKFLNDLAANAQQIVNAGTNLILAILRGIAQSVGLITFAVGTIITTFINAVRANTNMIVTAGSNMIISIMTGIGRNMERILQAGISVVKRLVAGIARAIPELINFGANMISQLGDEIRSALSNLGEEMEDAAYDVGYGIGDMMASGLSSAGNLVKGAWDGLTGGLFGGSPAYELGIKLGQELSNGISDSSTIVKSSMNTIGRDLQESFNEIVKSIYGSLSVTNDFEPTITPVLDLSQIEKEASKLERILKTDSLVASLSNTQAQAVVAASRQVSADTAAQDGSAGTVISFEQTINAPTALSTGDIYKQTKSQITMAKEELKAS